MLKKYENEKLLLHVVPEKIRIKFTTLPTPGNAPPLFTKTPTFLPILVLITDHRKLKSRNNIYIVSFLIKTLLTLTLTYK